MCKKENEKGKRKEEEKRLLFFVVFTQVTHSLTRTLKESSHTPSAARSSGIIPTSLSPLSTIPRHLNLSNFTFLFSLGSWFLFIYFLFFLFLSFFYSNIPFYPRSMRQELYAGISNLKKKKKLVHAIFKRKLNETFLPHAIVAPSCGYRGATARLLQYITAVEMKKIYGNQIFISENFFQGLKFIDCDRILK